MMVKRLLSAGFLLVAIPCLLMGQQLFQYSLYMLNPYAYSPAYVGTSGTFLAHGAYRQQWAGLDGAPETQYLDAQVPVYFLRGGVGLRLANAGLGAHRTTRAVLHYAHHIEIGRAALLSVGAGIGYLQYTLDGTRLRTPEGLYEPGGSFTHNDPSFPEGRVAMGAPLIEAGAFFRYRQWEVSGAVLPVYAPLLQSTTPGAFRLRLVPQYALMGTYRAVVSDRLAFIPSFLLKVDAAATQVDISTTLRWRENTFAGCSFRGLTPSARDAVVVFGGMRITEKISFAYAYDIPLSSLAPAHRGTHELLLRYDLGKSIGSGKLPPIIYNPRFW